MYVKLKFNTPTRWTVAARLMTGIINGNTYTTTGSSAGSLNYMLFNGYPGYGSGFHTDIRNAVDANNCIINRTVDPSGVTSHFWCNTASGVGPASGRCTWTLEFPVHDETTTKYYYQLEGETFDGSSATANTFFIRMGDSISGGTINSSSLNPVTSDTATSHSGIAPTHLILGNGTDFNEQSVAGSGAHGSLNYCYHFYVSNNALAWNATGEDTVTGFPSGYTNATKFIGNFIASQYTRYDNWNRDSNGIIPVMYTTPYYKGSSSSTTNNGKGFPNNTTFVSNINAMSSDQSYCLFKVFNTINAGATTNFSFPLLYHPGVDYSNGFGTFTNYTQTPYSATAVPGTTTGTGITSPQVFSATSGYFFPNIDNTGPALGLFPIYWKHGLFGNMGGNMSDKSNIYLLSGEFTPGDTFAYNGRVYVCWPNWDTTNYNSGLAVPRE